MKYYLAGPMTGIPHENIPLFKQVLKKLTSQGYDVTSPVDLDDAEMTEKVLNDPTGKLVVGDLTGETWGDFLSRDVKMIADELDAIILLPDWEKSKGARLEAFVAVNLGYPCFDYDEGIILPGIQVSPSYIMEKINESLL